MGLYRDGGTSIVYRRFIVRVIQYPCVAPMRANTRSSACKPIVRAHALLIVCVQGEAGEPEERERGARSENQGERVTGRREIAGLLGRQTKKHGNKRKYTEQKTMQEERESEEEEQRTERRIIQIRVN